MGVFEDIEKRIRNISKIACMRDDEIERLMSFHRISEAEIRVNGKSYAAWRIVHSNALGPSKGGIRFHPNVSEDEVRSLAFWMSIKNSLVGLPYGGAKGGVRVNPKELDNIKLEELSRAYVRAFHKILGQDIDIPAPDVYTNPQVMAWMLDEFERIKGRHEPGFITGKPLELGGCQIRDDSTSRGGYIIFKEFAKTHNMRNTRVAIQGFGNAGWNMARLLHSDGYNIIAVSDSKGGIYDKKGLDVKKIKKIKDKKGSVVNYEAERISNRELLELDADVLVLAALENQITRKNAKKISSDIIIELANGPVDLKADDILNKNGITVIPDIIANAGGVVGSYFEWVQNKTGWAFDVDYIKGRFEWIMKTAFGRVHESFHKNKRDYSMRTIAYIMAIERIIAAERVRGRLGA